MPNDHTDVVLFFDDLNISKEMLLPEFEAVLDHVVSMPELASQRAQAAYVRANPYLQVQAIVFFTLEFDKNGVADPKWNLPLEHLASNSSFGPDLGAGKVRLACFSQCPIPWHQKQLWDPVMSPSLNTFVQIRNAVANNRLGLVARLKEAPAAEPKTATTAEPPSLNLSQRVENNVASAQKVGDQNANQAAAGSGAGIRAEQRDRIAQLIKSQRFHIATLKNQRQEDHSRLKREFQKQLSQYDRRAGQLDQKYQEQKELADSYKELLDEQVDNLRVDRERFAIQLQEARSAEGSEQLAILQKQFAAELQARVEADTAELKQMLEKRNVELFYREEQMTALREEIANLRQEKVRLLNQGANSYLEQLTDAGVDLVAHHDGAGHISIPVAEVGEYLDSPQAYVAKKCYVEPELYEQWLEHYSDPVCQAPVNMGDDQESFPCGRQVSRVEIPNQYVSGFNDRCPEHQGHCLERQGHCLERQGHCLERQGHSHASQPASQQENAWEATGREQRPFVSLDALNTDDINTDAINDSVDEQRLAAEQNAAGMRRGA